MSAQDATTGHVLLLCDDRPQSEQLSRWIASAGHEEELLSNGAIDGLEALRDHHEPAIRDMARDALWLLTPDVEDRIAPEPIEED